MDQSVIYMAKPHLDTMARLHLSKNENFGTLIFKFNIDLDTYIELIEDVQK